MNGLIEFRKNRREARKKERNKRTIKRLRQLVMNFGDVVLPIYIGVTSFLIAYLWLVIFYNNHRTLFLDYLLEYQGGGLIADFFFMGMLLVITFVTFGVFSMLSYKYYLELKAKGYKKNKSLFERAVDAPKVKGKKK